MLINVPSGNYTYWKPRQAIASGGGSIGHTHDHLAECLGIMMCSLP